MEKKNNIKYKIVSLFTGCGGFDLGFSGNFDFMGKHIEKLPTEIVFANDIDIDAVSVYKENSKYWGHDTIEHNDVRNLNFDNISACDILLAGFPCQPFSNAGNRKGVNDHRGTLYEDILRFVDNKQPKIVVLENVKGILSSKMPTGITVVKEIVSKLQKKGYNVSEPKILKASNYGVPQNRERVIIIGVRNDLNIIPNVDEIINYKLDFNEEDLFVGNVLKIPSDTPNVKDVWDLSPQALNLVKYIKRSWKDVPYEALPLRMQKIRDNMKKYHSPNFYRRFALNEIMGTVTASAQPENCGIVHPIENRRYSVREIARFQSFPDDYTFNAPLIQNKYKVIGNAIPPILANAIAKYVINILGKSATN